MCQYKQNSLWEPYWTAKARPEQHPHINISIQAIPLFQYHPHPLGAQIWILKDSFTELFILTKMPIDDNDNDNDDDGYEDDKNYY